MAKMRQLSYEDFLRLLEIHQPVRVTEQDIKYVNEWDRYADSLNKISIRRMDTSKQVKNARAQLKTVLSEHQNITLHGICDEMSASQIRQFEDDEKERMHLEFERVAAQYAGINEASTGGYVSVWNLFPRPFSDILIRRAAGTKMRIIPVNRYRSYSDEHSMMEEMIDNAIEHGNGGSRDKNTYLLWHQCPQGKEICIVDEGKTEFDLEEIVEARRALLAPFGKSDDVSGIDMLRGHCYRHSTEFEYFSIRDSVSKRGTLLRILLEKGKQPQTETKEVCGYLGHQMFKV